MMWALLLLAAAVAIPLVLEMTRKPMNDRARRAAPGQFAALSRGMTHFRWQGPENGPVVVCIHGLTTPSFVWESISKALADRGFRVLTYDLYGRGYSDRPRGRQDPAFFIEQLNGLLDSQHVEDDVSVIGYSMGGAIAAAFAASQPHGVREVVLLAPGGMTDSVGAGMLRRLAAVPALGLWLVLLRYPQVLRKGIRAEAALPSSVPDLAARQEAELDYRGFLPAIHASLLGTLTGPLSSAHETLHREEVPVMAIWGARDEIIPLAAKDMLETWNPDARQEVIAEAGHGLTYTHTPQVLSLIEDFVGVRR